MGCCSSHFENHSFTVDMPLLAKLSCDIIKNVHILTKQLSGQETRLKLSKKPKHMLFSVRRWRLTHSNGIRFFQASFCIFFRPYAIKYAMLVQFKGDRVTDFWKWRTYPRSYLPILDCMIRIKDQDIYGKFLDFVFHVLPSK